MVVDERVLNVLDVLVGSFVEVEEDEVVDDRTLAVAVAGGAH